jgi:bis(5'-nucleosyl)-tetraphosphatase (symmetrical)
MATYVIGDVQGCYTELVKLLDIIKFDTATDRLWFVGDLVNRGHQSLAVLRLVKSFGPQHSVVLGNHDLHLLVTAAGCQQLRSCDTFTDVLTAPDRDELLFWLRHCKFCHFDKKLNFIMTHAGIAPQWDLLTTQNCARELEKILQGDSYLEFFSHMYGDKPDYWNENLTGWDRYRYIVNALTRMRYCYQDGRLELSQKGPIGSQPHELVPWFALPERQCIGANIVFGHWASLVGRIDVSDIFAVDTGCCWGRKLTAMRLEDLQRFACECETELA